MVSDLQNISCSQLPKYVVYSGVDESMTSSPGQYTKANCSANLPSATVTEVVLELKTYTMMQVHWVSERFISKMPKLNSWSIVQEALCNQILTLIKVFRNWMSLLWQILKMWATSCSLSGLKTGQVSTMFLYYDRLSCYSLSLYVYSELGI